MADTAVTTSAAGAFVCVFIACTLLYFLRYVARIQGGKASGGVATRNNRQTKKEKNTATRATDNAKPCMTIYFTNHAKPRGEGGGGGGGDPPPQNRQKKGGMPWMIAALHRLHRQ